MKNICVMLLLCCLSVTVNAKVKIGTPVYDPPYAIDDPKNGVSGFDIDFMKKICGRLNWDCEFTAMHYFQLLDALEENKIDFAVGSIVIEPARRDKFLYSIPYLLSNAGFLVTVNSPINTVLDLKGKTVGAIKGKAYITYLQEQFSNQMTIVPYDVFRSVALDLDTGKIDAVFMNYMSALYLQHQFPEKVKVLNEHFRIGEGIGIITLPANKDKIDQINKVILQFQADGTFIDLYNYNFQFFIR